MVAVCDPGGFQWGAPDRTVGAVALDTGAGWGGGRVDRRDVVGDRLGVAGRVRRRSGVLDVEGHPMTASARPGSSDLPVPRPEAFVRPRLNHSIDGGFRSEECAVHFW